MPKKALVLSGGGMFGAWQAGAWSVLAKNFQPDLVVGASVGSLNGYAIAAGTSPDELCDIWTRPGMVGLARVKQTAIELMRRPLQLEFAVVLTDLLRMKPVIFTGAEITPAHLEASCAVPLAKLPVSIGGTWYVDGGLLNPLPVFAAVERGATEILALHALPHLPGVVLPVLVKPFLAVFGYKPPVPAEVQVVMLKPPLRLGSWSEAIRWNQSNSRRWLQEGAETAKKNISALNCFGA
jgi:NTE family protein